MDHLDQTQVHMLGLITQISFWYNISDEDIKQSRENYLLSYSNQQTQLEQEYNNEEDSQETVIETQESQTGNITKEPETSNITKEPETKSSKNWGSDDEDVDYEFEELHDSDVSLSDHKIANSTENEEDQEYDSDSDNYSTDSVKIWIKSRREFKERIGSGIKICPNYSDCELEECANFHIKPDYICDHAVDDYCHNNQCEKIIIKKCRKGKKCKDNSCSYRHI